MKWPWLHDSGNPRRAQGKSISFLVDMGATNSILPSHLDLSIPSQISVMGIDGSPSTPRQTTPLACQFQDRLFSHSFLIIQLAPSPYWDETF